MYQASWTSQNSPVDDISARGVDSRQRSQQDLMEIRRQRELNKARKEKQSLDQSFILENLAKAEPSAVTFLDKSRRIELDADGNEIPRNPKGFESLNPTALPRQWGNPDGAAPFYPAYHSRDNPGGHQDPQARPFTVGVYPTNQPVYPHQPIFQPVNQPVNQQAIQPVDQPIYQPGNQPINQPGNQHENPQFNQWNVAQYPQNATPQPYNPQNNVWSTSQADEIITQQPHNQTDSIIIKQDEDQSCTAGVYLAISVFTILFCCCTLGSVGFVYSLYAWILNNDGDFTAAKRRAATACRFNIAAVFFGVVIYGVLIAMMLISTKDTTKH